MARPDKAAAVAEITEEFTSSGAAVLTEYRGLTVSELTELRRALGTDVTYSVVKNTLTKIALKSAEIPSDEREKVESLLAGPTAIAFVRGDPVDAAKGLRDFARTHPHLVIKGGLLESRAVSPAEIRKLADLESREVLLAKLAGAMKASLSQAVSLFAAPLSQAARLFAALQATLPSDAASAVGPSDAAAEPAAEPAAAAALAEAPAEESAEAPAEESAEAPAEETGEAPAEESAEAPAEESAEAPAEESAEAPAEESAEAPVESEPVTSSEGPADAAPSTDGTTETTS